MVDYLTNILRRKLPNQGRNFFNISIGNHSFHFHLLFIELEFLIILNSLLNFTFDLLVDVRFVLAIKLLLKIVLAGRLEISFSHLGEDYSFITSVCFYFLGFAYCWIVICCAKGYLSIAKEISLFKDTHNMAFNFYLFIYCLLNSGFIFCRVFTQFLLHFSVELFQLYLTLNDKVKRLRFLLLLDDLFGYGENEWFWVADYKL